MMAMTTNSSIRVKPRRDMVCVSVCRGPAVFRHVTVGMRLPADYEALGKFHGSSCRMGSDAASSHEGGRSVE